MLAFESLIVSVEFKSPNLLNLNISSKDLFSNKRCRDDKSTETESSKAATALSPEFKKVKIIEDQSVIARRRDSSRAVAVAQHSMGNEPIEFAQSLESLLLPQTVEIHSNKKTDLLIDGLIGSAYHTFQDALMLRRLFSDEVKTLKGIEVEHGLCKDKLKIAQARAADYLKSLKKVQGEFDEFSAYASAMHARFAKDSEEAIKYHIMRTRAEVMLEFKNGELSNSLVDQTVAEYNDKYPERALFSDEADDSEHQAPNDVVQPTNDEVGDPHEKIPGDDQDDAPDDE